ncbi:hypothetical protein CAI21_21740 [Alkalilimnicola ehrlichii]|uniref:Uncharacterized protein n=1 Tax=Alkalilimnicola ehrlichii TaxID=351052 RepID=A0A3E0WQF4_9GAMM|nr:hypothetical protein CAI21_21740 [Alkalilimnicola ehrlichii]RFA35192.1 hypothetical protein CAL65_13905 [Alkalilimnicola ehrlichii]
MQGAGVRVLDPDADIVVGHRAVLGGAGAGGHPGGDRLPGHHDQLALTVDETHLPSLTMKPERAAVAVFPDIF